MAERRYRVGDWVTVETYLGHTYPAQVELTTMVPGVYHVRGDCRLAIVEDRGDPDFEPDSSDDTYPTIQGAYVL